MTQKDGWLNNQPKFGKKFHILKYRIFAKFLDDSSDLIAK